MTGTDSTWAIRVEAHGLEDVVAGPLTRAQADALVGIYLDRDRDEAIENDGPTRRRITVEEYDPADPDLEPLIPEGAERTWWPGVIFFAAFGVVALYFAFRTYGLQITTPRLKDTPIATGLAFIGTAALFMFASAVFNAIWDRVLRRWTRSRRQRLAEVAS